MKRALFCLILSALPAKAGLWEAVCRVESGGNALAIGDKGRAAGIAQIWGRTVSDINRFAGTKYTLNDRFDPIKSKEMFTLYVEHYAKGRSLECKAHVWNGGPNALKATGNKKLALENYWNKIKKHL